MNISNIFLISLWKLGVAEVINNRHYHFPEDITKVALTLADQPLSIPEQDLLELHNWLVIEVEPFLEDASAEDLENYFKSHLDEINRDIKELNIINPEENDSDIKFNKNKRMEDDDSVDSFLNQI